MCLISSARPFKEMLNESLKIELQKLQRNRVQLGSVVTTSADLLADLIYSITNGGDVQTGSPHLLVHIHIVSRLISDGFKHKKTHIK